jgi:hypothetical protein
LHEARHYAEASRQHRAAGEKHPDNCVYHAEQERRFGELAEDRTAWAVQAVCNARRSRHSRWLRSRDPAVRAFVLMHVLDRRDG